MGSCRKTCARAVWLNLAAHPAQDESAVSFRICSRDTGVHPLSNCGLAIAECGLSHQALFTFRTEKETLNSRKAQDSIPVVRRLSEAAAAKTGTTTGQSKIGNRKSKMRRRRGQESNLPRLLRTDHGFEDREGHQAPFTLRGKENVQRPTSNVQHSTAEAGSSSMFGVRCSMFDVCLIFVFGPGRQDSPPARRNASDWATVLFCLFDRLDHGVEVRPVAGLELGMEQFAIGLDFEGAAT